MEFYLQNKDSIYTMILESENDKIFINNDYIYFQNINKLYGYDYSYYMLKHIFKDNKKFNITILTDKPNKFKNYNNIKVKYANSQFPSKIIKELPNYSLDSYIDFPILSNFNKNMPVMLQPNGK